MKKLLYIVLCIGGISAANAGDCDWATITPPDDAKYKYFVARVYSEESISDAQIKAEQEINNQICRLFGAETITTTEYYADETSASGTSRTNERCVGVKLEQFIKERTGDERVGNEYVACVQYRYAQSAYRAEFERIKNQSAKTSTVFNETSGDTNCVGAPVQITTTPSGAGIYLNGKYRGDTPLKIGNVCRGKYTLKLTHDNYETVEQQLIVPTNNNKVAITLKRATKTITISADDSRAHIKVNGRDIGRTPVDYKAKLGETIEIEASADGVQTAIQRIKVDRFSDEKIKISLDKNPVKLDFSGWLRQNPGWDIFVDGDQIGATTTITPDENHSLRFTKDGFRTIRDTYSHRPTDNIVYFDKTYPIVPVKSMARTNGTEFVFLPGIGATYTFAKINESDANNTGVNIEPVALRLRADVVYARLAAGYNTGKFSTNGINIKSGIYGDLNLGVNIGDYFSAFGITGIERLNIVRPEINDKNFSGDKSNVYYGLGVEYNMTHMPFSIRLSYTTSSIDLWNDFYAAKNNVRMHKIGLSFHLNWSALSRIIQ